MTPKRWIACSAFSALILASLGWACADGDWFDRLFDVDAVVVRKDLHPVLFNPFAISFGEYDYGDYFHDQNLREWSDWFGADSVGRGPWEAVLYKASLTQIDSVIFHLKGQGTAPAFWKDPSGIGPAQRQKLLSALMYVGFATRVEPASRSEGEEDSWREKRKIAVPADPGALAQAGLKAAHRELEPFLRQRKFFQVAKLLFYVRPDSAMALLDRESVEFQGPSESLRWRAAMYRAGLLRRRDSVAANMECARVARNFPPLLAMAARDFQFLEQAQWLRALKMAKTPQDKEGLWLLFGIRYDGPLAIQKILALDSSSRYPVLLAVREEYRSEINRSDSLRRDALTQLAMTLARSRRVENPAFWNLLAGHQLGLHGKEKPAMAYLDSAERLAGSSDLAASIHASRILVKLAHAAKPSADLEAFVLSEFPKIDSSKVSSWLVFLTQYRQEMGRIWASRPGLAEVLRDRIASRRDTLQMQVDFWNTPGTAFEKWARARSRLSDSLLRENLGVIHLYENRFDLAEAEWKHHPPKGRLQTDPFNSEIQDDHERDHMRFADAKWTRLNYVRELITLESMAGKGGPDGAKAALRLGIGLYNRTWYGNARSIYAETVLDDYSGSPRDLAPARKWFEQASRDLPSAEGRAWATWLVAKCERDTLNPKPGREPVPVRSYARLKAQSGNTSFWNSALKECGWLATWNQGH